jgi:hypothetical protein
MALSHDVKPRNNMKHQYQTVPLEIDDGTVIIDNGDINLTGNEDSPELYDLENASSIAPSDIDVSYYYGASRHGKGVTFRLIQHNVNFVLYSVRHGDE